MTFEEFLCQDKETKINLDLTNHYGMKAPMFDLSSIYFMNKDMLGNKYVSAPKPINPDQVISIEGAAHMLKAQMIGEILDRINQNIVLDLVSNSDLSASYTDLDANNVISHIYEVCVDSRSSASFLCNGDTLKAMREVKDSDGRFLYQESFDPDKAGSIVGYPIHPTPAAPHGFLAFGNFREVVVIGMMDHVEVFKKVHQGKTWIQAQLKADHKLNPMGSTFKKYKAYRYDIPVQD